MKTFEEFVKIADELATGMLVDTGRVRPTAYICDGNLITIGIMIMDKPMWRPFIKAAVNKLHAIYYAFVDEAWYVQTDEWIPGNSLRHNPCRKELLHIFSYAKDGQKNVKVKPFKRVGKKIEFEDVITALHIEIPAEKVVWKDQLIGNVFTDEKTSDIPLFPKKDHIVQILSDAYNQPHPRGCKCDRCKAGGPQD